MVQMCLSFIAFAKPRLTILALRQAVSTPDVTGATLDASNTVTEQEISRRCSSLIRKTKAQDNEYFDFAHFSVQEILQESSALAGTSLRLDLQAYFIDEQKSRETLAAQNLRFLQLKNFHQHPEELVKTTDWIFDRDTAYPFYPFQPYAGWSLPQTASSRLSSWILPSLFSTTPRLHVSCRGPFM
jgi:hypothetical protein